MSNRGLEGSGGEGGEGLKVEPSEGSKGAQSGLQGGLTGASRGLHLQGRFKGFEGGFNPSALKRASRMLEGGFKGGGLEGGFKGASP